MTSRAHTLFQNSHHQNQAQEENFYRRFERVIGVLRNLEIYNLLQFLDVMDSFEETFSELFSHRTALKIAPLEDISRALTYLRF